MGKLEELNEAIRNVIEIGGDLNDETNALVYEKAPLIVHQAFCAKLVGIAKDNGHLDNMADCPEFMDMLTAIRMLEGIYPQLDRTVPAETIYEEEPNPQFGDWQSWHDLPKEYRNIEIEWSDNDRSLLLYYNIEGIPENKDEKVLALKWRYVDADEK